MNPHVERFKKEAERIFGFTPQQIAELQAEIDRVSNAANAATQKKEK